jgi:hypothetical protein
MPLEPDMRSADRNFKRLVPVQGCPPPVARNRPDVEPRCRDPEQTWGRLSRCTLERTQIIAKPRKPLAKETLQLTVEDGAANLQQLVSPLRGPAHGLLLAHSVIDEVSHSGLRGCARDSEAMSIGVGVVSQTLSVVL